MKGPTSAIPGDPPWRPMEKLRYGWHIPFFHQWVGNECLWSQEERVEDWVAKGIYNATATHIFRELY